MLRARQQVMSHILEQSRKHWQDGWQNYPHARQTKQFLCDLNIGFSRELLQENRASVTKLISAVTGHGPFAYHHSLLSPDISPVCRFCDDCPRETFCHFLTDCPCFAETRFRVTELLENNNEHVWTVGQIKSFIDTGRIRDMFELVENSNYNANDPDILTDVSSASS